MKDKPICAIVAEYNPFHNGHLYQIQKTKEIIGDAYVVAIMSGNFTQRGLPAIADKFSRAKAAVLSGVDMVIELPAIFATQSADIFAGGAIKLIKSIGFFDYISFGAESDNIEKLKEAAEFFASPSAEFETVLRSCLSEGDSFPRARARAYSSVTGSDGDFLSHSNNILALEYLKHISLLNIDIKPICIGRKGPDFNDEKLNLNFSSATSIRKYIKDQVIRDRNKSLNENDDILKTTMPLSSLEVVLNSIDMIGDLSLEDNLLRIVKYRMITENELYKKVFDLSEDTFNFISQIELDNYDGFIDKANTKNITAARVQRILNNIFLEITPKLVYDAKIIKKIGYVNVLSVSKESRELLSVIAKAANDSEISVITQAADIKKLLFGTGKQDNTNEKIKRNTIDKLRDFNEMTANVDPSEKDEITSRQMLELDLRSSSLYELISKFKIKNMDYYVKRL